MQGLGWSDARSGGGGKGRAEGKGGGGQGGRRTTREKQAANQPQLEREAEVFLHVPNRRLKNECAPSARTRALAQILVE